MGNRHLPAADVINLARGNRHLPAADVINLARGNRHLPAADVINLAMGNRHLPAADVINLAMGNRHLPAADVINLARGGERAMLWRAAAEPVLSPVGEIGRPGARIEPCGRNRAKVARIERRARDSATPSVLRLRNRWGQFLTI